MDLNMISAWLNDQGNRSLGSVAISYFLYEEVCLLPGRFRGRGLSGRWSYAQRGPSGCQVGLP